MIVVKAGKRTIKSASLCILKIMGKSSVGTRAIAWRQALRTINKMESIAKAL